MTLPNDFEDLQGGSPVNFLAFSTAAAKDKTPDASNENMFDHGYCNKLATWVQRTSFRPESALKLLELVSMAVKPEYYNLSMDALILHLMTGISTTALVVEAHQKPLREYSITYNLNLYELDSLEKYIKTTDHPSHEILRQEFQLLDVTLQIYRWRYKVMKSVLSSGKSLLCQGAKFSNNVTIESAEMDLLKKAFISQARKIRQEIQLWSVRSTSRKSHLYPSLRFQPRKGTRRLPTEQYFQLYISQLSQRAFLETTPKLEDAAKLALILFGNIFEGQICSSSFKRYRLQEVTFGSKEEATRLRHLYRVSAFFKSWPLSSFCRALKGALEIFSAYFNNLAIRDGIECLADSVLYPIKPQQVESQTFFQRSLKIRFTLLSSLSKCTRRRVVEHTLKAFSRRYEKKLFEVGCRPFGFEEWFFGNISDRDLIQYLILARKINRDGLDHGLFLNYLVDKEEQRLQRIARDFSVFKDMLLGLAHLVRSKKVRMGLSKISPFLENSHRYRRMQMYMKLSSRLANWLDSGFTDED